jgi:hypothetical protein
MQWHGAALGKKEGRREMDGVRSGDAFPAQRVEIIITFSFRAQ